MTFRSDFRAGRTWDDARGLELKVQSFRDGTVYRILRNGQQVAQFSATSESRELAKVEKEQHPAFDKAITWHVESRGGQIADPARPGKNILDEIIVEALTAFQGLYGSAGFRDGSDIHAIVEVKLPERPLPDLGPRQLSVSGAVLESMKRHPLVAYVLFAAVSWLVWTFFLKPLLVR